MGDDAEQPWRRLQPTADRRPRENLRRAIAYFEAALRVYTEADFPSGWAMRQNNLGNAYSQLPAGDRAENLCRAIRTSTQHYGFTPKSNFPCSGQMHSMVWVRPPLSSKLAIASRT